jgi:hypothetical protein
MTPSGAFRGDYIRLRIKHDVRKPLTRFLSIVLGGKRFLYAVKYEKLGQLCFACGLIGHVVKECGNGLHDETKLKYGDWIYANPPGRGRGAIPMRGGLRGGYSAGRGGFVGGGSRGRGTVGDTMGRGRGEYVDWRLHPERGVADGASVDKDLRDTATSPIKTKDIAMSDAEKNAKKRIAFEDDQNINPAALALTNSAMHVDGELLLAEGEGDNVEVNGKKRHKSTDGTSISGASTESAASLEGDRRVQ